ncbi:MAG: hypothetical protein KJ566_00395 [Nanoarchaeota archaeon]|nr:hypothetical protein [Nanoarchaeota archaeon]
MLGGIISLASYGYYGGTIGNVLSQWEQQGVFSYVFPFLLIFSLIYGLLGKMPLFTKKSGTSSTEPNNVINAIISMVVGLMALQFEIVPRFFAEIFPKLGVGLAILLVVLVLGGLFIPTNKENNWVLVFLSICFFALIIWIITDSFKVFGWTFGTFNMSIFWYNYSWLIILIGFVVAIILSTRKKDSNKPMMKIPLSGLLGGDNE